MDAARRIDLYWRLAQLEAEASIDELAREIAAQHGRLPAEPDALARLRLKCRAAGIAEIIAGPKGVLLTPRPQLRLDRETVVRAARHGPARLKHDGRLAVKAASRLAG